MSAKSGIEWTDATWNPTIGCSLVSPGCTHCYAMKDAHRLASNPMLANNPAYQGVTTRSKAGPVWTNVVNVSARALLKPLGWRNPRFVFVNSIDRKSVVYGKSVSVSVDLGGRRIITKTIKK